MEPEMIYFGLAVYAIMLVIIILVSIWLLRRSFIYFKKHDREKDMLSDKWGVLSIVTFVLAILVCVLGIYLLSWFYGVV
jgi:ABC-type Fe3+ transport system permease subunit